jgi:DNA-directed RNA polymerase specialized sigma24 family protein
MDEDDVQQFLRVKVWKGSSPTRRRAPRRASRATSSPASGTASRISSSRPTAPSATGPSASWRTSTRATWGASASTPEHLAHDEDGIREAHIERTFQLPSTLNFMERVVTAMLYEGMNQTEIAQMLGCTRTRVRNTHSSVQRKMMDWAPGDAQETSAETAAAAA